LPPNIYEKHRSSLQLLNNETMSGVLLKVIYETILLSNTYLYVASNRVLLLKGDVMFVCRTNIQLPVFRKPKE